jgi:hypothetical protein
MAAAAETLRATYPAWQSADQESLKTKLLTLFYPPLHNFLIYHEPDGLVHTSTAVNQHFFASWDAGAMATIAAIGVFADDRAKYQEALDAFKNGTGNGAIFRAVWDANSGQLMESGRDPEHAQLGIGELATLCEIAWNQGDDLYGYDGNRLLKGFEYTASYLLGNMVPFSTYSDPFRTDTMISQESMPAQVAGAMSNPRPIYEMVWNHYLQRRNVPAPFTRQIAEKIRPEGFNADHIGYGTLFFTREPEIADAGSGAAGGAIDAGRTRMDGAVDAGGADNEGAAGAGDEANHGSGGATGAGGAISPRGDSAVSLGAGGSGGTAPQGSGGMDGGITNAPEFAGGCSCRTALPRRPGVGPGLLVAVGLWLARRRMRQRFHRPTISRPTVATASGRPHTARAPSTIV